ncbi:type II toxin-antitoxin system VapC family toxin [Thioflexithrix psekupsensis]|uniref:Twitching motility protein PilT n=1 Tax=Thioflexithrix psekupsensis TaxID=1570016 RepID=A0A251XA29_9GAMM|nr:type II toxin-antitoxin system VapC family toxin [Thioflexithrix psekupsensis]OUD14372.1 twitching motility protein PilT [Thioflexithrix psekupsensis]
MILLDTHIWVRWVNGDLPEQSVKRFVAHQESGLGVSLISCWEIAKLVEYQRLKLRYAVQDWLQSALVFPGVVLLDLSLPVIIESTQLPQSFHRDPVNQLIVATARIHNVALLTLDEKILAYPHVKTL